MGNTVRYDLRKFQEEVAVKSRLHSVLMAVERLKGVTEVQSAPQDLGAPL